MHIWPAREKEELCRQVVEDRWSGGMIWWWWWWCVGVCMGVEREPGEKERREF
jgi:hypothetical protein